MLPRVAVLMGGCSAEREISLRSGKAIVDALRRQGYPVEAVDLQQWPQQLLQLDTDVAFIALHGTLGEDGCIQGLLEIMGVPYTGSGVTASALCMNKRLCKQLLQQAGLSTAVEVPLSPQGPVRYPVLFKPVSEGSSVGLHRLACRDDWDALKLADDEYANWMAEMPVQGPELAISVLDGKALPPVEIVPHSGCYDYQSKYTSGATDYFTPARIPPESLRYCMEQAEIAVKVLGCLGTPRVDMIVDRGGDAVILEVNTLPGMTATSLLPKAAEAAGISFEMLCDRIVQSATLEHRIGLQHGMGI